MSREWLNKRDLFVADLESADASKSNEPVSSGGDDLLRQRAAEIERVMRAERLSVYLAPGSVIFPRPVAMSVASWR